VNTKCHKDEDCGNRNEQRGIDGPASGQQKARPGYDVNKTGGKIEPEHKGDHVTEFGTRFQTAKQCRPPVNTVTIPNTIAAIAIQFTIRFAS